MLIIEELELESICSICASKAGIRGIKTCLNQSSEYCPRVNSFGPKKEKKSDKHFSTSLSDDRIR